VNSFLPETVLLIVKGTTRRLGLMDDGCLLLTFSIVFVLSLALSVLFSAVVFGDGPELLRLELLFLLLVVMLRKSPRHKLELLLRRELLKDFEWSDEVFFLKEKIRFVRNK
jgi:hypothetical protein